MFLSGIMTAMASISPEWSPRFIIRDLHDALHAGIHRVFPDALQIACWFHVTQCIRRKRGGKEKIQFVDDHFDRIITVMRTLHFLTDPDMLAHGYFLAKQELDSVEFWTWWEAAGRAPGGRNQHYTHATVPAGIPLTDNALERNNRTIKSEKKYGFQDRTMPFFEGVEKLFE